MRPRGDGGGGRRAIAAALGLALGLAFTWTLGCGERSGPGPGARVAGEAEETGAGGAEDDPLGPREPLQLTSLGPTETVVIALRALPEALDPLGELDPWGQRVVDDLLFEGLVRRSPAGHPWAEPALADRCEVDDDLRGLRCHLPEGRSFHDGEPVTIDDVLYSLEGWLGGRAERRRLANGLDGLKAIAVDDGPSGDRDPGRWLRITFEERDPLILERIAAMKVVPKARHRGRAQAFAREPIGSGPMRLVSLDKEKMVLERRDDADPERTGARRIVLRALPDGAQALMLLRRGEVHMIGEVSPVHVPRELQKPGMAARFRAYLLSPPRYDLLLYNLREGPQSGPRLRAALAQAIPWATLEGEIYGRPGLRLAAPVDRSPPQPIDLVALADGQVEGIGLDPWLARADPAADAAAATAAAATLDALGWELERGVRRRSTGQLRLPLMWDGSSGLATELSGALRNAWRELGVQAPSVTAHWGYLTKPLGAGDFSLALVRYADVSESDLHGLFHSRGKANFSGVVDPALDAAIEAFRAARTPEQRRDAQEAMAGRLAELQPATVLHAPLEIMLASRRITGLTFVDDLPRLDRLGLGGEGSDAPLDPR
ncbi:MAG: ABC transporter substrate-binding protein [Myxococcales bacterium]|nr:ABC transporter substrate-binding protein [Myxococcales bacterium]